MSSYLSDGLGELSGRVMWAVVVVDGTVGEVLWVGFHLL